jgi:hypothetical protein
MLAAVSNFFANRRSELFMMASPIMVAIDDRAADQVSKCVSECSPADGTNDAVNGRDYGRSRWQLSEKITTSAGVHVRGRSTYFAVQEPKALPRSSFCSAKGRFCDGFRMPANATCQGGTGAGVRKPPKNETAGSRASGGSAGAGFSLTGTADPPHDFRMKHWPEIWGSPTKVYAIAINNDINYRGNIKTSLIFFDCSQVKMFAPNCTPPKMGWRPPRRDLLR